MNNPTPEEHQRLLDARRRAQAAFPVGHPERVKAERAVRQSRIARRSRGQWAARALRIAKRKAAQKPNPRQEADTLYKGIETALKWLDGTHPKAS
jgi:hypothetical protein